MVVEGEEELRRIMAEPLEKWRVFLHPTQRKIVNKDYSGAARVLGGAGTGKTVVAMHRAKHLAAGLNEKERLLFTTYTANLASDIRDNLRKICSMEELRRIDVINLDAWVAQFLREHGYSAEIVYDDKLAKIWEDVVAAIDYIGEYPVSFYEFFQLGRDAVTIGWGAEIREINFRLFHKNKYKKNAIFVYI